MYKDFKTAADVRTASPALDAPDSPADQQASPWRSHSRQTLPRLSLASDDDTATPRLLQAMERCERVHSVGAAARRLAIVTDALTLALAFAVGKSVSWLYNDFTLAGISSFIFSDAFLLRAGGFAVAVGAMLVWFLGVLGHYDRSRPYWDEIQDVLNVVLFGFMLDALLVYLGKWQFSRLALGTTWTLSFLLLPLSRLMLRRWMVRHGWLEQPYVIIGSGVEALKAIPALGSERFMDFRPIGLVLPPDTPDDVLNEISAKAPNLIVTRLNPAIDARLSKPCRLRVVVALDTGIAGELIQFVRHLTLVRDDVYFIPAMSGLPLYGMEMFHFFSHEVLLLRARNNLNRRSARVLKRLVDIAASAALLAMLAPFMLFIALQIRRDGGKALFGHTRVGQNGQEFECLKFRTMVSNSSEVLAELLARDEEARREWEQDFKLKNDPRITAIGRFLRKTSLDELPQLINVLRGEMSLVGPRPVVEAELERYGDLLPYYLKVRPGISGLWQVSGRSDTDYDRRVWLDRWYVQNWSLWYDLVILFKTVRVVLKTEGAY